VPGEILAQPRLAGAMLAGPMLAGRTLSGTAGLPARLKSGISPAARQMARPDPAVLRRVYDALKRLPADAGTAHDHALAGELLQGPGVQRRTLRRSSPVPASVLPTSVGGLRSGSRPVTRTSGAA